MELFGFILCKMRTFGRKRKPVFAKNGDPEIPQNLAATITVSLNSSVFPLLGLVISKSRM